MSQLRAILPYYRPYRAAMAWGMVLVVIAQAFGLASPWLVPSAAAALSPDDISHSGLRRMLAELYSIQAAGLAPDMDSLRERLLDCPELFESAKRLHEVGHQVDRESDARSEWLGVILKRFTDMRIQAEERRLREQLGSQSADEDSAVELLRRLQQTSRSRDGTRPAVARNG